jgi:16S rRNA processing protein RimM
MEKENFFIAQIGRTIGLWGDLKLHLHTDFPEQFKVGHSYKSSRGELTISDINFKRGTIRFQGYESIDSAKKLTNTKLFSDEAKTKSECQLKEGQHFWFDIVGCRIEENGKVLGHVKEIQRMLDTDYLLIETNTKEVEEGLPKSFLLPYIPRYILKADIDQKVLYTEDARDILEAS